MPRIRPTAMPTQRPVASWASGRELVGSDRIFRGWFLDVGIDERLDAACAAAGWQQGQLSHLDGEVRLHWLLPSPCLLFVLIKGVPYTSAFHLGVNDVAYSGIKATWPKGGRSMIAVQCLHPDLLDANYLEPIPFIVKSTQTDDLVAALLAHDTVLDLCEAAAREKRRPRDFEFWEVALPIAPGDKVQRGRELTSPVSPMVCAHPAQPDVRYLRRLLAPAIVAQIVQERWPRIERWAMDVDLPRAGQRDLDQDDGEGGAGVAGPPAPPTGSAPAHRAPAARPAERTGASPTAAARPSASTRPATIGAAQAQRS